MAISLQSKPCISDFNLPITSTIFIHHQQISRSYRNRRCLGYARARRAKISCCGAEFTQLDHSVTRRFSPLLESSLVPNASNLSMDDWKAVPDIWRSSAQKYGDRIAVVDPYHSPQMKLTYNKLEQDICSFAEGLRVVGVLPNEKVALFADNSCRWLIADQVLGNFTCTFDATNGTYLGHGGMPHLTENADQSYLVSQATKITDGIMATGAINVVRGPRSSNKELLQMYIHSESVALVVDSPEFFDRLVKDVIPKVDVRFVILLWGDKSQLHSDASKDIPMFSYDEIVELGRNHLNKMLSSSEGGQNGACEAIKPDDVATIMYTSGTSGSPKGVMLTHKNLLHQIRNLWEILPAKPGDRFLSMLPSWHVYERACEYFIFTHGIEQVYTNVKSLKDDLRLYQPHYLISVPLVFENLYSSIHKQISSSSAGRKFFALTLIKISLLYMEAKRVYEGKVLTEKKKEEFFLVIFLDWLWARFVALLLWPMHKIGTILVYRKIRSAIGISKAGISGGGSLAMYVDKFFEAIGVKVQNGYGLTETSPVLAARLPSNNVLGTVGHPLKYTEIKIFDKESGESLQDGFKGIIKARGPQVMKGYYKNPSATKEAIDGEGWFNTGDIGWFVPRSSIGRSRQCGGMLVLEGRAKDTIVLTTGENVEPSEIEEAAMRSSLIQQIVVVGQDQRRLGALVVPNKDEVMKVAMAESITKDIPELTKVKVLNLIYKEVRTWTSGCSFQIGPILIVDEPFTIENGLMTPTMKVRRDKVVDKYHNEIAKLYK